ncbi:Pyrimidine-specific ribonucleoside hydrolase RihB [Paenibacillus sp. CECT 9249]|uniref:nucleoside hydrolase n=1 Tax=Paenibacillus sp. CECT 9249 TaxID=2845385 RepID=UPI001E41C173|nr:nucleoside hydrolase [Paenibacillus sp. CECT 9249]CAH0119777.1 Pyrimidine-specific ribonucleoside hydrolase RihB [Paenibacillus sp. CECT 9249]
MNRVIIDTDIGSDIDDAMAIALAMRSPEITIEGITTVYGDAHLRARMVAKMLQYGGRQDVPVFAGIDRPLLHNREVWMAGHEGVGLIEESEELLYEDKHAVDFIVETVMANPGQITLIPIGPLTNIAASIVREPRIARNVKEIILMGGVARLGDNGADIRHVEHNIVSDPESASLVFRSGAPIVMVGLDVTLKVVISERERRQLLESGDSLNVALAGMMERWFQYNNEDFTFMHDPLTVALVIDRSLVKTKKMKVNVEYDHRLKTGQTIAVQAEDANVDICLDVDPDRMVKLLMERLLRGDSE